MSMEYVGYVYKCICLITNKVYIGITTETIDSRKARHIRESFNQNTPSYNYHFHRAIRKYGSEQFEWTQLEMIKSDTKENLIFCLKQLEIKYISLFNSYVNGYNSTLGGDNSETTKKGIIVYLKDGTKINEFESIQDASKYYKVGRTSIGKCCNKITSRTRSKDYGVLLFRFKEDPLTQEELYTLQTSGKIKKSIHSIPVKAYYKDTKEFIGSYESYSAAEKALNLSKGTLNRFVNNRTTYSGKYNGRLLLWEIG